MSSNFASNVLALWKNKFWEEGTKKPRYTGTFTAPRDIREGEVVRLSVWINTKTDNPKAPIMSGKEDTFEKEKKANGDKPMQAPALDDVPW